MNKDIFVTNFTWTPGSRPWASVAVPPQSSLEAVARAFRASPGWLGKKLDPAVFTVRSTLHGWEISMASVLGAYPGAAPGVYPDVP